MNLDITFFAMAGFSGLLIGCWLGCLMCLWSEARHKGKAKWPKGKSDIPSDLLR
jgi:hypothetical protein